MAIEYSKAKKATIFIGAIFVLLSQTLSSQAFNTLQAVLLSKWNAMSYFAYLSLLATVGTSITVPIAGKLSDIFGRRTFMWIGAFLFLVPSIVCSRAESLGVFLAFRALIPFGQGILMVVPFAILAGVFPGKQRNMAYGCLSAALAIGYFLGGAVGGWLADIHMTWVAIAYPGVLAFVGAVLMCLCIKDEKPDIRPKIDFLGIILLSVSIFTVTYAASFGSKLGWSSLPILATMGIAIVAIAAFVKVEQKSEETLLPVFMFKNPQIVAVVLITFFTVFYQITMGVYAPLLIQKVLGMSAAASGTVFVTRSITNIIFPPIIAAWLIKNLDARTWKSLFFCGLLITIAFVMIAFTSPQTSLTLFFISFGLLGIAESFKQTTITPYIQSFVEMKDMGAATAVNTFFGVISGTISGCILGIIYNSMLPDPQDLVRMNHTINTLFLVTALTGIIVMFLSFFVVRGKKQGNVS
ncbi:MFS transporter [Moorellaceae bacterium AZ2]